MRKTCRKFKIFFETTSRAFDAAFKTISKTFNAVFQVRATSFVGFMINNVKVVTIIYFIVELRDVIIKSSYNFRN